MTTTGVKDKYLSSTIFILDLEEHIDFVWVKPTLTKSRANNICGGKERKQKQKESFSSSHNELLCLKSFSWKSKGREATLGCGDKLDRFFGSCKFCLQASCGIKRQLFLMINFSENAFMVEGLGMKEFSWEKENWLDLYANCPAATNKTKKKKIAQTQKLEEKNYHHLWSEKSRTKKYMNLFANCPPSPPKPPPQLGAQAALHIKIWCITMASCVNTKLPSSFPSHFRLECFDGL